MGVQRCVNYKGALPGDISADGPAWLLTSPLSYLLLAARGHCRLRWGRCFASLGRRWFANDRRPTRITRRADVRPRCTDRLATSLLRLPGARPRYTRYE